MKPKCPDIGHFFIGECDLWWILSFHVNFPLWTGLRTAFPCFIPVHIWEQFGNNWEQICYNSMVILEHNRRNRRLFSPFPLFAPLSHWRSRGFESRQVHWITPISGRFSFNMSTYGDHGLILWVKYYIMCHCVKLFVITENLGSLYTRLCRCDRVISTIQFRLQYNRINVSFGNCHLLMLPKHQ